MKWKEEALEKLRNYEPMRAALMNLPREIRVMEEEYEALRSASLVRMGNETQAHSREDRMLSNIVYRQELQRSLEQTQRWMQNVSAALGVLDPEEKGILHGLYICPHRGAMEQLCERLHVEKSSIYRKRDTALRKFTLAMYGAAESN